MTDLEHILKTLEYEEEDKKKVTNCIGTLRRLLKIKKETLKDELGGVIADEMYELKKWYKEFRNSGSTLTLKKAFTAEIWDDRFLGNSSDESSVKSTTDPMKKNY